jgi:thymidylate synthase
MHVISVRNVCEALPAGVALLRERGVEEDTRAGPALVLPCPVTTCIERPAERVLFSAKRDANPAFHMFEAIWILAGRNDVAALNVFIRDFGERFGEPDGTMHGAYGHRWRAAFEIDQLDEAVAKLKRDPSTRQIVLQMWHAPLDLLGEWKDRPCNTHIYVRAHNGRLDLTICCRSNDVIWGAYGANAVHFSVLQEYLAARLQLEMGVMYQISNNFHGYLSTMDKMSADNRYADDPSIQPAPMFRYRDHIDSDIELFMSCFDNNDMVYPSFVNPWFNETLVPMIQSYRTFRTHGPAQAAIAAAKIKATDWGLALSEWYQRRVK